MSTPSLLSAWRAWLVAAGRPASTVKLRLYQLARLVEDHPDPLAASTDDLVAWLAGHDWSPETRRSYRAALRTFYGWAVTTRRLEESPAALLPPIAAPARMARPTPERIVADALVDADERVQLMAHLAARVGLRRGEIARVHSDDLFRDLVGWSLLVHGKGRRERVVPIPDDVAFLVRRRTPAGGWCFPGAVEGHLSPARVGELVSGALPKPWTCHTLRHRFATRSYAHSGDLLAVQALLGHAKPETTQRYVLVDVASLRSAVEWAA